MGIRVLVASHIRLYREALGRVLEQTRQQACEPAPQVVLVGLAASATEAVEQVRRLAPDIALLDMAMSDAFSVARHLARFAAASRIVSATVSGASPNPFSRSPLTGRSVAPAICATCSFTLTVLSPVHVVFDSPCDDNINDNTCERDAGFTDMNCPDNPSTPEIVTRFNVGDKICHTVRLLDCNDNDVTCQLASFCTVHIDVTERQGSYYDSILVRDLTEGFVGVGTPGGIMVPRGSSFQYVLDTRGYEARTVNNSKFFRSCVWIDYNTSPGVPVGMEDVVSESK